MKKKLLLLLSLLMIFISSLMTGCHSTEQTKNDIKSPVQTLNLQDKNGESVEITFQPTDNLSIVQDGNGFEIYQAEKKYVVAIFLTEDTYIDYLEKLS